MLFISSAFFRELRSDAAGEGEQTRPGRGGGPSPPIAAATTISSQFCGPTSLVAANAATTYLFADGVHPTTVVQGIFAQFVEGMIDGPIAYSTLAEVPMRTRAGQLRTLSDAFASRKDGDTGFSAFVSGDRGNFDVDPGTPGIG